MLTNQKKNKGILVIFFIALFIGISVLAVSYQKTNAKADNEIAYPFIGQDSNKSLEQNEAELINQSGVSCTPMLTVFIPDIGEDASAWSNNYFKGGFSYNAEYLPEQIVTNYNHVQVYSAHYDNSKLYIAQMDNTSFVLDAHDFENEKKVVSFSTDVEKHRVVLLSFSKKDKAFADAYAEVNKLITLVLYDLRKLTNLNATVNIIGHGRGGLLGIKYTVDHPEVVNSIHNIGTPHNGSDTAKLLKTLKNYNCIRDKIEEVEELLGGNKIEEYADGNSVLYGQYTLSQLKSDWNNVINHNPHIKAYAYAGAVNSNHFDAISDLTEYLVDDS